MHDKHSVFPGYVLSSSGKYDVSLSPSSLKHFINQQNTVSQGCEVEQFLRYYEIHHWKKKSKVT